MPKPEKVAFLGLWDETPEQLKGKQIQQLIAFSGAGNHLDPTQSREMQFIWRMPMGS
jgi:hypothetical protein